MGRGISCCAGGACLFFVSYRLFRFGAFSGRYAGIYCPLFSVFLWRLFSGAASVGGGSADPQQCNEFGWAAVFGTLVAFLLTYAAVALGSLLVFQLTRRLGRPFAERFVSRGNMDKYRDMIERKQDVFFAMAFLLPGFPDDILCFLAGLTTMPLKRFFLLVLLCRPWGLLVSCAVGGNALALPTWLLVLLCAAGAALFLIAMKYGDRWESALLKKLKK